MPNALIIILIAVAVYFIGIRGKSKPNTKVIAVGAALALLVLWGGSFMNFFKANTYTSVPETRVNSCGCQPGDLVLVSYKPFLGKKRTQRMPCDAALNLMSKKPKRTSLVGCAIG